MRLDRAGYEGQHWSHRSLTAGPHSMGSGAGVSNPFDFLDPLVEMEAKIADLASDIAAAFATWGCGSSHATQTISLSC